MEMLRANIVDRDGWYKVHVMLTSSGLGTIDINCTSAEGRFGGQLRRHWEPLELLQEYDGTIGEYFSEHHAERVPSSNESLENIY